MVRHSQDREQKNEQNLEKKTKRQNSAVFLLKVEKKTNSKL